MAEDAAGAAVQVLVQNLISLAAKEIELLRGFKNEFEQLKNSLTDIQNLLSDAESKEFHNNQAVKGWLKRLEDVAFDADAVIDEINYYYLRQEAKKRRTPETKKVMWPFSSSSTPSVLFRREMAQKICYVNQNLTRIYNSPDAKGLQAIVASAQDASILGAEESDSFMDEPNIVGRDNDVAEVVDQILRVASSDKAFSVISIVGMGGLGKTTLTTKIFNHGEIDSKFGKKLWVSVSFDFDELSLFKKILQILTKVDVKNILSKQDVLERIEEELKNKSQTYLLVLDDVWNDKPEKWYGFARSLSRIGKSSGNVILVTTRSMDVASIMESHFTLPLTKLSADECWSIIEVRSSVEENVPEQFKITGKQIAERCAGLPLAARVVGGMMKRIPKEEWSSFMEKELLNLSGNPVVEILKLSYNRLPSSALKRCFAYCSIFPQDTKIYKGQLIELWMAEGFLNADEDMEGLGNRYFNILLQNSLLQDVSRDEFGDIIFCGMHDFVQELACSISGSKGVGGGSNDRKTVRYLYQVSNERPYSQSKELAKYVRTLVHKGKVSENFFLGFNQLHALKLEDLDIEELSAEIEKQVHLRFLDISNTSIERLPASINKLSNMLTLVVPKDMKLPSTITELFNMRHLHISSSTELPPCMGKLTSLRTLPYYHVGDDDEGYGIRELGKLKRLAGKLKIRNLERVSSKEEAERADLYRKLDLSQLILDWDASREAEGNDESVLEGLQPHPNFKCLKIKGYGSKIFPSWTMKMRIYDDSERRWMEFAKLTRIHLQNCKRCEEIPSLGHLPSLKFLELEGLDVIESICRSFYGLEQYSTSTSSNTNHIKQLQPSFPALEELKLFRMPKLKEWTDVPTKVTVFPRLKKLVIESCPYLKNIPSNSFPCLEELQVNIVLTDFPLTDVCSNIPTLQRLKILNMPGLGSLEISSKNRNLSYLSIQYCEMLKHVWCLPSEDLRRSDEFAGDAFESAPCQQLKQVPLEKLHICVCKQLESVSISCPSLRKLKIFGCREFTHLSSESLASCTSSLQKLHLEGLDNFRNLDPLIPYILRMSHLLQLNLLALPKVEVIDFHVEIESVSCLSRLESLVIGGFSESCELASFNNFVNAILPHQNNSLRELDITGQQNLESNLPDQIQHYKYLQDLYIFEFGGIEALPEWIGNLSSLEKLVIGNCSRLRDMASKETMQRLTKLSKLFIRRCPLIAAKCSPGADEHHFQRLNISHIEKVYIHGRPLPTRNSAIIMDEPVQAPAPAPIQHESKFSCCLPLARNKRQSVSSP